MTASVDDSGSLPPQNPKQRRRIPGEELALVALAFAILLVPAWIDEPFRPVEHGRWDAEPLLIDVESSDWAPWTAIAGIGEARARRIVEFVEANRPLGSIDELRQVPGMPKGWLEAARPYLVLSREAGGSPLTEAPSHSTETTPQDDEEGL